MRAVTSIILLLFGSLCLQQIGRLIFTIAPYKWCTYIPVSAMNFQYCEWRYPDVTQDIQIRLLLLAVGTLFLLLGSVLTAPRN